MAGSRNLSAGILLTAPVHTWSMSTWGTLRDEFAAAVADRQRAGLIVAYLLLYVVVDGYAQVIPLYYRSVGVSIAAFGLAKSAGNAVEAVASTPAGVLADTADRAAVAVVTGGVLAAVLVAFPAATTALTLGALVVVFAVARIVFEVVATPLLSESLADGSEGVGWAVRDVAVAAGGAVGIGGAGVLVARLGGVSGVFLALAPAAVALVAIVAVSHRPSFRFEGSLGALVAGWPPNPLASFRTISRPWVLARFLGIQFFAALGMGLCFYLLPVYAVDLGISPSDFLLAFGAAKVLSIPFTLAGGVLTDLVTRKWLYVANFALDVLMLSALALAGGAPLFLVGLGFFVLSTTGKPALLAYFFDQFDEDESGRAWGIEGSVIRGVGIVAPAAGAALYGIDPSLAFGAGAVSLFCATLVALTLPR